MKGKTAIERMRAKIRSGKVTEIVEGGRYGLWENDPGVKAAEAKWRRLMDDEEDLKTRIRKKPGSTSIGYIDDPQWRELNRRRVQSEIALDSARYAAREKAENACHEEKKKRECDDDDMLSGLCPACRVVQKARENDRE